LREERGLRVLRKIFEPKRNEVTGEWSRLHNGEVYRLYSLKTGGGGIFSAPVQTGPGTLPASYTLGTGSLSMGYAAGAWRSSRTPN